ncbi:MAG: transposase, partial [Acidobacteria bacterium]|nr:transposase [Acidobacteriota bacterium]
PDQLRRVRFFDAESHRQFTFLTNNFVLPPLTIAHLYKHRWQVEIFFKWIKSHLLIERFYGTSLNAVKIQIWVAITIYVLAALIKQHLRLDRSLYEILQILSVTLFEKVPLIEVLTKSTMPDEKSPHCKQLKLFDF